MDTQHIAAQHSNASTHQASATPDPVQRVVDFFESLQPQSIPHLGEFYTQDVYFKDPFNMYVALEQPHFVVTQRVVQGNQCFLVWDFKFRFKRFDQHTEQVVRGTTHLHLAVDGRISYHRDYWDAAEELYEKLPWLGGLMRWLKKRANS
jgi:steroid Delta-isomerase